MYYRNTLHFQYSKCTLILGIVNAGCLPVYDDIPAGLLKLCEDILWNKTSEATEQMLTYCQTSRAKGQVTNTKDAEWRGWSVEKRLAHSLVKVDIVFCIKVLMFKRYRTLGSAKFVVVN